PEAAGRLLGLVAVRSTLSVNPPGALGRLVGSDAVIEIGNTSGGTWTDFTGVVPAPPVDLTHNGVAQYRADGGDRRLGAVWAIRGTPWAVWVEFPQSLIVAPARVFLQRMLVFALFVVGIAALLVRNLSVGITQPLHELAQAAEGISTGDFSRHVPAVRPDEIG